MSRPSLLAPLGAFAAGSVLVLFVTGIVSAVAALAVAAVHGVSLEQFARDPSSAMGPGVLGFGALVQASLMGAGAWLLASQMDDAQIGAARVLGLVRANTAWIVAGGLGALTVGLLPGWFATRLVARFPDLGVALGAIAENLASPDPFGKAVLAVAICVAAPLGEELAFRGYLWHHLERALPGWGVWLATSLLFAMYHLDPVQSPSLIPTALFLGFLRWRSGSVVPAVFAHATNNALAVGALLLTAGDNAEPEGISFAVAATGAGFTVLCCALAAVWEGTWTRR